MALDPKDIETIERIVYKLADDTAIAISRALERMEERIEEHIDSTEARLYTRIAEVEDRIEGIREDLSNGIAQVRGDIRELLADDM